MAWNRERNERALRYWHGSIKDDRPPIFFQAFDDLLEKTWCLFSEWAGPTSQWHFQEHTSCLPSFTKELCFFTARGRAHKQVERERIQVMKLNEDVPYQIYANWDREGGEREGFLLVWALKTLDNLNPNQGPEHWMVSHEPPIHNIPCNKFPLCLSV